jgi:hypothetical protein
LLNSAATPSDGFAECGGTPNIEGVADQRTKGSDMARILTVVSLLGLLAFVLWVNYQQWATEAVDIPAWGWAAIILGTALSLLVGFGLMALMFYSARHGYDEGAQQIDRERK